MIPYTIKIAGPAAGRTPAAKETPPTGQAPGVRGLPGNRVLPMAALMFLTLVAASTSHGVQSGPGSRSAGQVARIPAPDGPDLARLDRAIPVESAPLASKPVDEALQAAASTSVKEFSGGPTGALLIGVALVAAIALLLAVAMPW